MSDDQAPFEGPLPDDFLAEFEEHLAGVESGLLALERDGSLDEAGAGALLRRLHTLKGLSGMVGLRAAERLAHGMETALRCLRGGGRAPAKESLDDVIEAWRALGLVLRERKSGAEPREFPELLRRLSAEAGKPCAEEPAEAESPSARPEASGDLSAAHRRALAAAAREGLEVVRAAFTPSAELAARGLSVATVRARLEKIGRVLSASPIMKPDGAVTFEFLAAGPPGAFASGDWERDGVSLHAYEPALPETAAEAASLPAASNTIRVGMDKLDLLLRMVGELVVARARLSELSAGLSRWVPERERRAFDEAGAQLERQVRLLRDAATRVRLVPIGDAFARMPFAAREVAHTAGKQVRVELSGQETELDKFVVDRMTEPLLHLVRNAAAHGIEPPAARAAAGKPEEGRVSLRASTQAGRVLIEVEDDGAGVDVEAVSRRCAELGLPQGGLDASDEDSLLGALCAPGLSTTRGAADLSSGRGVGMAAVRDVVRDLGGRLSLRSKRGAGAVFAIEIPMTMLIVQALIVADSGRTYAVPASTIEEVLDAETAGAPLLDGAPVLSYRGGTIAVASLGAALGGSAGTARHILVARGGGPAFGVERVLGQREIVVSALSDPWIRSPGVSGAARLPDGSILVILDLPALAKEGRRAIA